VQPLVSHPAGPLHGAVRPPGDKSISHRALMIGAVAVGQTRITGLLEGADVLATAEALRRLGAEVTQTGEGAWSVWGRGVGGLAEPSQVLDLGNSGTAARLLMGLAATHPFTSFFTGDRSLNRRPMARVTEPLTQMGAQVRSRSGGRLPLALIGAAEPVPIRYAPPVASAQVKSAVLFAGLNAPGETTVIEPAPTRDHSERMLRHFGAELRVSDGAEGREVTVVGYPELEARGVAVPADPSSAAFAAVAALIVPDSEVHLLGVATNPGRTGLYETLREMGADIDLENVFEEGAEPVADLAVKASALRGVTVPAARAPSMIDEYPVLAVAAAYATGTTVFEGVGELRVKESDRLAAITEGLRACGVAAEAGEDRLAIEGCGGPPPGPKPGTAIATHDDHRIAMAFLVMGMAAQRSVTVDDGAMIDTSFPGFAALMTGLGAEIHSGAGGLESGA
jgi:3-phosphoshikimate 1-carboxyvinyltransferase